MYLFAFGNGALIGAGLIIAIGAQNLFVLRQGIAQDQIFIVCLLSACIDATLILIGAIGLGGLIATVPWLVPWATWGGAAFLVGFGLLSLRRVIWPAAEALSTEDPVVSSAKKAAMLTLAFGFLNPHVYLDTVVLLGSIAAGYQIDQRVYFVAGAITASFAWFFSLGYGARALRPFMKTVKGARILDGLVAAIMFLVAANLVFDEIAFGV